MSKYLVTLELTTKHGDPSEWDWNEMLDLNPVTESVFVSVTKEN